MFIMVFITTNGVLCNLTTANWFIVGLSYISPTRFNCEGFVRIMSAQIPDLHRVVDQKFHTKDLLAIS